jgi:hypothetical protein
MPTAAAAAALAAIDPKKVHIFIQKNKWRVTFRFSRRNTCCTSAHQQYYVAAITTLFVLAAVLPQATRAAM